MKPTLFPRILAALVVTAGVLLVACNDDGDEPDDTPALTPSVSASATPEPETTPTTEAESPTPAGETPTAESATATPDPDESPEPECPVEDVVCNLAESIEVALDEGNYGAIVDLVQPQEESCPGGQPQGAGGPFPLCEGAPQGEVRTGYQTATRYSEGGVVDREGLVEFIQSYVESLDPSASDEFGTGALELHAVSCVPGPDACDRATVIFGGIDQGGLARTVLVFWIPLPAQPEAPISQVWNGVVQPQEWETIFETGGNLFDLGEVYVLPE